MVMIGISVNGCASAGVLYQPFSDLPASTDGLLTTYIASKITILTNLKGDLILDELGGRTIWGIMGLGAFGLRKSLHHPARKFTVATSLHHSTKQSSEAIERLGEMNS